MKCRIAVKSEQCQNDCNSLKTSLTVSRWAGLSRDGQRSYEVKRCQRKSGKLFFTRSTSSLEEFVNASNENEIINHWHGNISPSEQNPLTIHVDVWAIPGT